MRVTNPFFLYLFTLSTSKMSKLKSNALLDSLTEKYLAAFSTLYQIKPRALTISKYFTEVLKMTISKRANYRIPENWKLIKSKRSITRRNRLWWSPVRLIQDESRRVGRWWRCLQVSSRLAARKKKNIFQENCLNALLIKASLKYEWYPQSKLQNMNTFLYVLTGVYL